LRVPIVNSRIALIFVLPALLLGGCLGNSGDPAVPPGDVQLSPGDGVISVSWPDNPTVNYWVFHAQDPTLTTINWDTLLNAGAVVNTTSPTILCGLVNNPQPTSYYPEVYFTINARTGTAPGGVGSALVSTVPRPAASPGVPWVAGTTIPAQMTGLGYAPLTSCGYAGRPPSGILVAVGPNSAIYYSDLTPTVAGPLSLAQGNQILTWHPGNIPLGFANDLTAVAGVATVGNDPTAPGLIFVAVGRNGSVVRSTDGQNWQHITGIPTTQNLNAIAVAGTTFVAVGDNGVILTSGDGLTWSLNANALSINTHTLNAIHCVTSSCVAVGQEGTTLWTSNSGTLWALYTFKTNNWVGITYGNDNANADAIVSDPAGVLTITYQNEAINTWLVVDAQGDYAYASSTGAWTAGETAIAPGIVAVDYTTHFVAIDSSGNTYQSEYGYNWTPVGPSNVTNPVALRSNGLGFIALGGGGTNASSF
jgi:hypothetical protein